MTKNKKSKPIFLVIALLLVVIAPLYIIFATQPVADALHSSSDIWNVYVPNRVYGVYGFAFLLFFLASFVVYAFKFSNRAVIISTVFLLLGLSMFYFSTQNYKTLSDNEITQKQFFAVNENVYNWDDLEDVRYFDRKYKFERSYYDFIFKDGRVMHFKDGQGMKDIKEQIYDRASAVGIDIIEYSTE